MTRSAMDALDAWADIRDAALTSEGMDYLAALNRMMRADSRIGFSRDTDLVETVYRGLSAADVYAPRPDVMDLIDGLAGSVPYHPVLSSDELPSPYGFVYLPRPIVLEGVSRHTNGTDVDVTTEVRAFQWWETTITCGTANGSHEAMEARTVGVALYTRDTPSWDAPGLEWDIQGGLGRWLIPVIFQLPADQKIVDRMAEIADKYGSDASTRMAQGTHPGSRLGGCHLASVAAFVLGGCP